MNLRQLPLWQTCSFPYIRLSTSHTQVIPFLKRRFEAECLFSFNLGTDTPRKGSIPNGRKFDPASFDRRAAVFHRSEKLLVMTEMSGRSRMRLGGPLFRNTLVRNASVKNEGSSKWTHKRAKPWGIVATCNLTHVSYWPNDTTPTG